MTSIGTARCAACNAKTRGNLSEIAAFVHLHDHDGTLTASAVWLYGAGHFTDNNADKSSPSTPWSEIVDLDEPHSTVHATCGPSSASSRCRHE